MKKTGNNNSELLDKFAQIASESPKKAEVDFDIEAILKNKPQAPSLKEILADVMKNGGKNITRTAQLAEAPADVPVNTEFDGLMDDALGDGPEGPDLGEEGCDHEAVKANLIEALIAMCGSPEEACDCIMGKGAEEGLPEDDLAGPPEELGGEMPGLDEPEPMAAPMPKPMPGIV